MENTGSQVEPEHQLTDIELDNADEYSRFLLQSRAEILDVLRNLIRKGALITVHFDQGKSFLLTALLAISPDNERIFLDIGSDVEMNRKALAAKRLVLTTVVDKVKVQFGLDALVMLQYEGRPAFSSHLPPSLLRLQRREFFRLSTPIVAPVNMLTTLRLPDGNKLSVDIPLFDISCGGVGLMVEPPLAEFLERGGRLNDCRIMLPEEGLLTVDLLIRNKFDVSTRTGYHFVRIGCEYIDISAQKRGMVQRYIIRIERERKARLSGLA